MQRLRFGKIQSGLLRIALASYIVLGYTVATSAGMANYIFDSDTGQTQRIELTAPDVWGLVPGTLNSLPSGIGWEGMALSSATSGYIYDSDTGQTLRIELTAPDVWGLVPGTINSLPGGIGWEGMAIAVPEPSSLLLAGFGIVGLAVHDWRRRKRCAK